MYFKLFVQYTGLISSFRKVWGYFFFLRYEINFNNLKQLTLCQASVYCFTIKEAVNTVFWHILET